MSAPWEHGRLGALPNEGSNRCSITRNARIQAQQRYGKRVAIGSASAALLLVRSGSDEFIQAGRSLPT
jgi:hypothetical protein